MFYSKPYFFFFVGLFFFCQTVFGQDQASVAKNLVSEFYQTLQTSFAPETVKNKFIKNDGVIVYNHIEKDGQEKLNIKNYLLDIQDEKTDKGNLNITSPTSVEIFPHTQRLWQVNIEVGFGTNKKDNLGVLVEFSDGTTTTNAKIFHIDNIGFLKKLSEKNASEAKVSGHKETIDIEDLKKTEEQLELEALIARTNKVVLELKDRDVLFLIMPKNQNELTYRRIGLEKFMRDSAHYHNYMPTLRNILSTIKSTQKKIDAHYNKLIFNLRQHHNFKRSTSYSRDFLFDTTFKAEGEKIWLIEKNKPKKIKKSKKNADEDQEEGKENQLDMIGDGFDIPNLPLGAYTFKLKREGIDHEYKSRDIYIIRKYSWKIKAPILAILGGLAGWLIYKSIPPPPPDLPMPPDPNDK